MSGLRYVCVFNHKHGQYANQQKLAIELGMLATNPMAHVGTHMAV